ncbi:MAG: LamG-like jellyroll fold domain-containing protein, partial [Candidatus Kapaibacteriota bacterium]
MKSKSLIAYLIMHLSISYLFTFEGFADWEKIPGSAHDIAAGNGDTIWAIGTDKEIGGYGIHKWDGYGWTKITGGAVRISVDLNGNPWVVNSFGNIFHFKENNWVLMPGLASDIGNGNDGSIWIIGINPMDNGNDILKWNNQLKDWEKVSGSGIRIAVDKNSVPWIVGANGAIYKYSYGKMIQLPGSANDIGGSKYSHIWVIGTDKEQGGFGIHKWLGDKWDKIPGGAENITVDDYGRAWVVNSDKGIYRYLENMSIVNIKDNADKSSVATLPPYVPIEGLIGFWLMNSNANDLSVNKYNGSIRNGVFTEDRFGSPNSALYINGQDSYVETTTKGFNTKSLSISAWFKTNAVMHDEIGLVVSRNDYSHSNGLYLFENNQYFQCIAKCGDIFKYNYGINQYNDNNWHHFMTVFNGKQMIGYVDGIKYGTVDFVADICIENPFEFGRDHPFGRFFTGTIDDIGIWNRALTENEVMALYHSDDNEDIIESTETSNSTLYKSQLQKNKEFTFIGLETKEVQGISQETQLSNGLNPNDVINNIGLVSLFYHNWCYIDGQYNNNNYKIQSGYIIDQSGKEKYDAYTIFEPTHKATKFLASQHNVYYRFPSKEDYAVYEFRNNMFVKHSVVPSHEINTNVFTKVNNLTVSNLKGYTTYIFVPNKVRLTRLHSLSNNVDGALIKNTVLGEIYQMI